MSDQPSPETRCGYVALIGRPNVGKSTLLNHILRQKISITSRKPQTTRTNLLGVDTQGQSQAVYVDTPGIHPDARKALNRYMVASAKSVIDDVDVRVLVLEHTRHHDDDERVMSLLAGKPGLNVAVLNKIDLLADKASLLPRIAALDERQLFDAIVPVAALKNEGVDGLRQAVFERLPALPFLFDPDQVTDQSERYLVGEIVREKLMRQLGDEIPHSTAVVIERFLEEANVVQIHAEIYVERAGQKRIVIGQGGERLKSIGQQARQDIERLLDRQIMLHLWVKVRKGWTDNSQLMQRLGYD